MHMKTIMASDLDPNEPLSETLVEELMADDLLPEYDIDYSRARPNRFAARLTEVRMVALSPDVAAVFPDADAVNAALRALMQTASASGQTGPAREQS